jgi:hypothetical protein
VPPTSAAVLAHALPVGVGAVPLALVLALALGAVAVASSRADRRAARRAAPPPVDGAPSGDVSAAPGVDDLVPTPGQLAGVIGLAGVVVLAVAGPADPATNLTDVAVLTLLWGAVALSSALAGPWWRRVNPLRGLAGLVAVAAGTARRQGAGTPTAVAGRRGAALAVATLLGWAWAQLVVDRTTATFQVLLLLGVALHVPGGLGVGPRWFARADPLEVVSGALGLLRPGGGGPMARLGALPDDAWLRWVCSALVGWSAAELVLETEAWHELGLSGGAAQAAGTAVLVGATALVAGLAGAAGGRVGIGPALVPVAAAWVVAQYLSAFLIQGQGLPIWLSDPFGTGADLLGRRGDRIDAEPVPPAVQAALQLVPFVAGHVAGAAVLGRRAAVGARTAGAIGQRAFLGRAVVTGLLLLGIWLQLGGL